jgi:hypothetical protein
VGLKPLAMLLVDSVRLWVEPQQAPAALALFWGLGADRVRLWRRLRPLAGLLLTLVLSAPGMG